MFSNKSRFEKHPLLVSFTSVLVSGALSAGLIVSKPLWSWHPAFSWAPIQFVRDVIDFQNNSLHGDLAIAAWGILLARLMSPIVRRLMAWFLGRSRPFAQEAHGEARVPVWSERLILPTAAYLAIPIYLFVSRLMISSMPGSVSFHNEALRLLFVGVYDLLELTPFLLAIRDIVLSFPIGELRFKRLGPCFVRWFIGTELVIDRWEWSSEPEQIVLVKGARRIDVALCAAWRIAAVDVHTAKL